VSHLASQDVRKQLFADAENDHSEIFSHQEEVDSTSRSKDDDKLFDNPLKNPEMSINRECSDLLEEISSDLAEKHRFVCVVYVCVAGK